MITARLYNEIASQRDNNIVKDINLQINTKVNLKIDYLSLYYYTFDTQSKWT